MKSLAKDISALSVGLGLSLFMILFIIICIILGRLFIIPLFISSKPPEEEGYPSWSPDRQHIAFVCYLDGPTKEVAESDQRQYDTDAADICVVNHDGTNRIRLTANGVADFSPTWSPDGTRIAYTSRDGVYLNNSDGSNQRRLVDTSQVKHTYELGEVTWSPDGKRLAFSACLESQDRDIYVVNVDNGILVNITSGNLALDEVPTWLPDSRQIMFLSSPSPIESCSGILASKSQLKLINIDGTNETNVYSIEAFFGSVAISAITEQVAFTANVEAKNDQEALVYDPYLFTVKFGEDKPHSWGKIGGFLTWSPDGRYLAYTSTSNKVILLDIETGSQRELPSTFSPDFSLTWSPDGQKLAATVWPQIDGLFVRRILIFDLNTNTEYPLLHR